MRDRARALTLALAVASAPACDKKAQPIAESVPMPASSSGVRVTVGDHGFTPGSILLPKGPPGATVPVTFLRNTDQTCAREVVFPEVGIKKDLPLGTPITVDIPADTPRTLVFQCGMAMYKGALVVK